MKKTQQILTTLISLIILTFFVSSAYAQVCTGDYIIDDIDTSGDIADLSVCTEITGYLEIDNSTLINLNGLENITRVGGNLTIVDNNALTSLEGLENITSVGGNLNIERNNPLTSLTGLEGLTSVGGNLYININDVLTNLCALYNANVAGDELYITRNNSLSMETALALETQLISNGFTGISVIENNDGSGLVTCDEETFLSLGEYDLSIWNFSGTYYEQTVPHGIANFTLVQDAKGKITGSGSKSYYSFAEGINIENIALDIKGKVKGKKGTVTVKIKTKGDSSASYDGKSYNIKSKDKITLGLNAEKDALVGTSKWKVCAKGKGCESGSNNIEIVLLPGMTGTAVVLIDSDNQTGKFSGNGKLILSNDDEYSLSYKAKHNSNKGETKYQLKGEKGIKFKLKMDAADNAMQINGKAFGQTLKYKK